MTKREGYEVFRLIERGEHSHASLDYTEGVTLYDWIGSHTEISKEVLYLWIRNLLYQLSLFRRQRGEPLYGHLTPHNVVIMRKNKIALRAYREESEQKERPLDKYFEPEGARQDADVYCFGKIIQFIMAHVQCEPHLSKIEEFKLQSIVKKCLTVNSRRQYENIHKVQANFMEKKKFNIGWKRPVLAAVGVFVVIAMVLFGGRKPSDSQKELKLDQRDTTGIQEENPGMDDALVNQEMKELFFQIGRDCFLEEKDYEKSRKYFQYADLQKAETKYYIKLLDFMKERLGEKRQTVENEMFLEELEKLYLEEEGMTNKEGMALIRAYALNGSEACDKKILELLEREEEFETGFSDALRLEVRKYLGGIYEKQENWKQAIETYGEKREIREKKWETFAEDNVKEAELRLKYLEDIWEDISLTQEQKLEEIGKSTAEYPEFTKNELFKKFIEERKIHIEEGKIWVEEGKES